MSSPDRKRTRGVFSDLHIHIVDFNIAPKRFAILKNVVQKNGAAFIGAKDVDDCTLIVADFVSIDAMKSAFDRSRTRRSSEYSDSQYEKMVRLEWLTLSAKNGSLLPKDMFRLCSKVKRNTTTLHIAPGVGTDSEEQQESGSGSDGGLLAPGYINDGWACKHRSPLEHPNKDLADQLKKIMRHRYVTGDARSELSYSRAVAALAGYPRRLSGAEEAAAIKGIGPKIAGLIGEYLKSGRIGAVDEIAADPKYLALNSLCDIYGVGPKTAEKWYAQGVRSHTDVKARQKELKLTEQQTFGLEYYEDLHQSISRPEAEHIFDLVKGALPDTASVHPTGGYRRGKLDSNDVDMLVYSEDHTVLERILSGLKDKIAAVLTIALPSVPANPSQSRNFDHLGKCLLIMCVPGQKYKRRVDIIHVPAAELLPWAQLGWTGSRQFERSIRLYAEKRLNITLSSDGAYCNQTKAYLHADDEEECFRALGLEFVEPEHRNC